jgi:preprotein translocase subunit SecB
MSDLNRLLISPSPLHLDGYFIRKLSFSISEGIEEDSLNTMFLSTGLHPQLGEPFGEGRPYFNVGFEFGVNLDNPSEYRCTLTVESVKKSKKKQPYNFEAEMVAFFTWTPETKDHPNLEAAVKTSAINMMYSALREALASATARSPLPALVLPSAWFKFFNEESEPKKTVSKTKQISSKSKKKTTKQLKSS